MLGNKVNEASPHPPPPPGIQLGMFGDMGSNVQIKVRKQFFKRIQLKMVFSDLEINVA